MAANLCDSNVWFAAAVDRHPAHRRAAAWLAGIGPSERVVFCRTTQQGLLRLLTNKTPFELLGLEPRTNSEAWDTYDALLADERISLDDREPPGTQIRWRNLSMRNTASRKLWTDAYLAAFAVCAGYRFVTFDAAFRQFDGLDLLVL